MELFRSEFLESDGIVATKAIKIGLNVIETFDLDRIEIDSSKKWSNLIRSGLFWSFNQIFQSFNGLFDLLINLLIKNWSYTIEIGQF